MSALSARVAAGEGVVMMGDELMAHWPLLVNYAHRRLPDLDIAVAEDLASHAVERALTRYRDVGLPDGLRRWLLTVVRNAVIDYRLAKRSGEVPLLYLDTCHAREDAGSDRHAEVLDVRAAIATLRPRYRLQVERFRDGYLPAEVAAETGEPYSTTKSVRHRALRVVSAALEAS
jgi:RNA polymerase sigma factor (sigma-70 family)